MSTGFTHKIIFLGQSGAGKSTALNALYNNSVERELLGKPAPVDSTAVGVTSEVHHYITQNGGMMIDTVGFDDNRFDPEALAQEMRRVLRASSLGITHIVLVVPLGRLSAATRVYLHLLDTIFGKAFHRNLALYVNRCEDGTTPQEFIAKNEADEDLGPLIAALPQDRILTGSFLCHRDPDRDLRQIEDRECALTDLALFTTTEMQTLFPPPVNVTEMIIDFINKVARVVFRVTTSLGKVVCNLGSNEIALKFHYPECRLCRSDVYGAKNMPMQLSCGHIFHDFCCQICAGAQGEVNVGCVQGGILMLCPACQLKVTFPGEVLSEQSGTVTQVEVAAPADMPHAPES